MTTCLYALPFLHYGVGQLVVSLIRARSRLGQRSAVVTRGGRDELADDRALLDELRSLEVPLGHADLFSRDRVVMREAGLRVARHCDRWGIDVVHALTAVAAAAAHHRPVVASVVGWSPLKTRWQRAMDVDILHRCQVVTAVSQAVVGELREAGLRGPVALVPNGVPCSGLDDHPTAPDAPIRSLGVMAHLVRRKGVDVALDAVASLPAGPVERLVIAGVGSAEADLRRLAARRPAGPRVEWTGALPVSTFLARVDAVLVPSRADALPMVLLQAMAAGLPVIASRTGGIPEAVEDRVDGLLVEPGDVDALRRAIVELTTDPRRARVRAAKARTRVAERFSLARMVSDYEDLYRQVLRGPRVVAASATPPGIDPVATVGGPP